MSLSIGKAIVFHPRNIHAEALGSRTRITSSMYTYTPESRQRVWKTHTIEATLRDMSPPSPASSDGALMRMSTKDRYIFELDTTADHDRVTEELRFRYSEKIKRQLAEYEANEKNASILTRMRKHADMPPILYLEASASEHIIAEGDTLSIRIVGDRTLYELLGYIVDIEVLD